MSSLIIDNRRPRRRSRQDLRLRVPAAALHFLHRTSLGSATVTTRELTPGPERLPGAAGDLECYTNTSLLTPAARREPGHRPDGAGGTGGGPHHQHLADPRRAPPTTRTLDASEGGGDGDRGAARHLGRPLLVDLDAPAHRPIRPAALTRLQHDRAERHPLQDLATPPPAIDNLMTHLEYATCAASASATRRPRRHAADREGSPFATGHTCPTWVQVPAVVRVPDAAGPWCGTGGRARPVRHAASTHLEQQLTPGRDRRAQAVTDSALDRCGDHHRIVYPPRATVGATQWSTATTRHPTAVVTSAEYDLAPAAVDGFLAAGTVPTTPPAWAPPPRWSTTPGNRGSPPAPTPTGTPPATATTPWAGSPCHPAHRCRAPAPPRVEGSSSYRYAHHHAVPAGRTRRPSTTSPGRCY